MGEVEARRLQAEVDRLEAELASARTPGRAVDRAEGIVAGRIIDDGTPPPRRDSSAIEVVELEEPAAPGGPPVVVAPPVPPPRSADAGVAGTTAPGQAASAAETASSTPAEGPQALYDRGYAFFHQKRYAEAESDFRQVLDRFPTSPLADNALFWIGESRYARGDLSSALGAYSETLERFPDGNKASHALYKAGRCLEALGRPAEAREAYRELRERFGGTAMADLAAERERGLRP